jgi:FAD/FMN-containing dehydrogenase
MAARSPRELSLQAEIHVSESLTPEALLIPINVSAIGVWSEPGEDELHIRWTRETAAAIEPWSLGAGYANYMQADEPLERVRAAFGDDSFKRLQALKDRYDPTNVLRRNQNIPPLQGSSV